jgi:hypothetical protein
VNGVVEQYASASAVAKRAAEAVEAQGNACTSSLAPLLPAGKLTCKAVFKVGILAVQG